MSLSWYISIRIFALYLVYTCSFPLVAYGASWSSLSVFPPSTLPLPKHLVTVFFTVCSDFLGRRPHPAFYTCVLWFSGGGCRYLHGGTLIPLRPHKFWALSGFGVGVRTDRPQCNVYSSAATKNYIPKKKKKVGALPEICRIQMHIGSKRPSSCGIVITAMLNQILISEVPIVLGRPFIRLWTVDWEAIMGHLPLHHSQAHVCFLRGMCVR